MEGVISNFKRSKTRYTGNQMIVHVSSVSKRAEAQKFVGKKVAWKSPGKEPKTITGEVRSAHGNSGALRVLFQTGMPGQAVGKKVSIS